MKDLVTGRQLCMETLKHQSRSGLHLSVFVESVSESVNNRAGYLVCAELLSEADVRAGHVYGQTVLHPLQETHPALTLLLKALLPQSLHLQLTARTKNNTSSESIFE